MWLQNISGGAIEGLVYAADGKRLYTTDAGGTVISWDTKTRGYKKLFKVDPLPGRGGGRAAGLFLAAKGRYLVVRLELPLVWDLKKDTAYARLSCGFGAQLDLRALPGDDSRLLHVADSCRSIATWECTTAKPGPPYERWERIGPLRSFDVAADGRTIALLDMLGQLVLFDLADGRERSRSTIPRGVERVRFAPDGTVLALFGGKQVYLWDVQSWAPRGEGVRIQPHHGGFAFHPTAPVFAAVNPDRLLTLYSLETGAPIRVLEFALARYVHCVTFAPDGLKCAAGGSNKQFFVFDLDVKADSKQLPGLSRFSRPDIGAAQAPP